MKKWNGKKKGEKWFSSQQAKDNFFKAEEVERGYLNLVFNKLPKTYDYKVYTTDAGERDKYDALLMRFKKDNGHFMDRFIVELKVRSSHYESLMLEKTKLDGLKKTRSMKDKKINGECYTNDISRLVYIVVSPKGTYWFNLDLLEKDLEWKEEEHWVSSTDKSLGREMKWVAYISVDKAKYMDIKLGDWVDPAEVKRLEIESKRKKHFAGFII